MLVLMGLIDTGKQKYYPVVAAHEHTTAYGRAIDIINATNETALMI